MYTYDAHALSASYSSSVTVPFVVSSFDLQGIVVILKAVKAS